MWWGLVPALIIVVIVVAAILIITLAPRAAQTQVLETPGTLLPVAGDSLVYVAFELTESAQVTGAFLATEPVWTYILNETEFGNLTSGGTPAHSTWSAGLVANLTFSVRLNGTSSGTVWYFTFINLSLTSAVVNLTGGISTTH